MNRRSVSVLTLLALTALASPAAAQREEGAAVQGEEGAAAPMVLGVYAPWLYFPTSLARGQYAEQLAGAVGRIAGLELRGRGFSAEGEFQEQIKSGQVAFAVVDAQYQIEKGLTALAQGIAEGRPTRTMVLVVRDGLDGGIADLKGKTLARVTVGPGDQAFITNYLLQNQVEADYFARGRGVRDAQGALSLVKLGKADATFLYRGPAAGIFESRPVPLPVVVQTRADLDPAVVTKVRQAILGVTIRTDVIDGFSAYRADVHEKLRGALRAAPTGPGNRPIYAQVREALPAVQPALELADKPPVVLPDIAPSMEAAAPPPDRF
ncbi:MAG: hypothetical protein KC620_20540 [Myxococcales bacterium]|nr:hypothetical protein [Myxococcales bacterium]